MENSVDFLHSNTNNNSHLTQKTNKCNCFSGRHKLRDVLILLQKSRCGIMQLRVSNTV